MPVVIHFFPTSNADPDSAIHLASHGDMNLPSSVHGDGQRSAAAANVQASASLRQIYILCHTFDDI